MTYEDENQNKEPEYSRFSITNLNRIIAILFVAAIYVVIFLKILFLE